MADRTRARDGSARRRDAAVRGTGGARARRRRSFDGTTIRAHFYLAANRAGNERVPTVLIGPGYPTAGDTNPDGDTSDQIGQGVLRGEGYNTLTWDPRGRQARRATSGAPAYPGWIGT